MTIIKFRSLQQKPSNTRRHQINKDRKKFPQQNDSQIKAAFRREMKNYIYEGKKMTPFLQTAVLAVRLCVIKIQARQLAKVLIEKVFEDAAGDVAKKLNAIKNDENNAISTLREAAGCLKHKAEPNSAEWNMCAELETAESDEKIENGYRIYKNFFSKDDSYQPKSSDFIKAMNTIPASGDGISRAVKDGIVSEANKGSLNSGIISSRVIDFFLSEALVPQRHCIIIASQ